MESVDPIDFLGLLLRIKVDVLLTTLSGGISVVIAWHCHNRLFARQFGYFTVTESGSGVIGICTMLILLIGATNITVATLRLRGFCRLNFNKYVTVLVISLLANFSLGMALTDYRGQIPDTLADQMKSRLHESLFAQSRLGVGFSQTEAWDFLQSTMHCCGVESYQEYFMSKTSPKNQAIPMSCCVMRAGADEEVPVVDNLSQCTLDASRGVRESIFLHVQGCHGPLSSWLVHHVSKMTAMLFAAILLQAVSILYLSWQGYRSSATSVNRDR